MVVYRPYGSVSWLLRCQNRQYNQVGDLLESPLALLAFFREGEKVPKEPPVFQPQSNQLRNDIAEERARLVYAQQHQLSQQQLTILEAASAVSAGSTNQIHSNNRLLVSRDSSVNGSSGNLDAMMVSAGKGISPHDSLNLYERSHTQYYYDSNEEQSQLDSQRTRVDYTGDRLYADAHGNVIGPQRPRITHPHRNNVPSDQLATVNGNRTALFPLHISAPPVPSPFNALVPGGPAHLMDTHRNRTPNTSDTQQALNNANVSVLNNNSAADSRTSQLTPGNNTAHHQPHHNKTNTSNDAHNSTNSSSMIISSNPTQTSPYGMELLSEVAKQRLTTDGRITPTANELLHEGPGATDAETMFNAFVVSVPTVPVTPPIPLSPDVHPITVLEGQNSPRLLALTSTLASTRTSTGTTAAGATNHVSGSSLAPLHTSADPLRTHTQATTARLGHELAYAHSNVPQNTLKMERAAHSPAPTHTHPHVPTQSQNSLDVRRDTQSPVHTHNHPRVPPQTQPQPQAHSGRSRKTARLPSEVSAADGMYTHADRRAEVRREGSGSKTKQSELSKRESASVSASATPSEDEWAMVSAVTPTPTSTPIDERLQGSNSNAPTPIPQAIVAPTSLFYPPLLSYEATNTAAMSPGFWDSQSDMVLASRGSHTYTDKGKDRALKDRCMSPPSDDNSGDITPMALSPVSPMNSNRELAELITTENDSLNSDRIGELAHRLGASDLIGDDAQATRPTRSTPVPMPPNDKARASLRDTELRVSPPSYRPSPAGKNLTLSIGYQMRLHSRTGTHKDVVVISPTHPDSSPRQQPLQTIADLTGDMLAVHMPGTTTDDNLDIDSLTATHTGTQMHTHAGVRGDIHTPTPRQPTPQQDHRQVDADTDTHTGKGRRRASITSVDQEVRNVVGSVDPHSADRTEPSVSTQTHRDTIERTRMFEVDPKPSRTPIVITHTGAGHSNTTTDTDPSTRLKPSLIDDGTSTSTRTNTNGDTSSNRRDGLIRAQITSPRNERGAGSDTALDTHPSTHTSPHAPTGSDTNPTHRSPMLSSQAPANVTLQSGNSGRPGDPTIHTSTSANPIPPAATVGATQGYNRTRQSTNANANMSATGAGVMVEQTATGGGGVGGGNIPRGNLLGVNGRQPHNTNTMLSKPARYPPGVESSARGSKDAPNYVSTPTNRMDEKEELEKKAGNEFLPSFVLAQLFQYDGTPGALTPLPILPEHEQDGTFERSLRLLDKMPFRDTHKIGVVYVAEGNTTGDDILRNDHGSVRYMKFLQQLGTLIRLEKSELYTGGLDREEGADGEFTYHWQDDITEVVFHVATLMPSGQAACVDKKRHIGNDFVTIVYNDAPRTYNLHAIRGQFNFIDLIIQPLEDNTNEVLIRTKEVMQTYVPEKFDEIVSDASLATFVRHIAIHANLASCIQQQNEDYVSNAVGRLRHIKRIGERMTSMTNATGGFIDLT